MLCSMVAISFDDLSSDEKLLRISCTGVTHNCLVSPPYYGTYERGSHILSERSRCLSDARDDVSSQTELQKVKADIHDVAKLASD